MNPSRAAQLANKTHHIEGWFSFEAAMLFAWIDEVQKRRGIVGDLFEIGVHHGKSALFLAGMMRDERETLGVCDIFGAQTANTSLSGYGDRKVFDKNMSEVLHDQARLRVFAKPSQQLSVTEIGTSHRFFHIDGGHNVEEALNDLNLAAAATLDDGVIAIDDAFRPEWPGVTEAICRFLTSNKRYCPIVAGFNKVLLVARGFAEIYACELDRREQCYDFNIQYPWQQKQMPFFDYPMRIFYVPSFVSKKSLRTRVVRLCRNETWLRRRRLRPAINVAKAMLHRWRRVGSSGRAAGHFENV